MIINNELQIPTNKGIAILNLKNIIHIEAKSNYSKIYLTDIVKYKNGNNEKGNTILVSKALKWFDDNLINNGFVRIHKSHLVNKDLITAKKSRSVQLNNFCWISISRRKKSCLA